MWKGFSYPVEDPFITVRKPHLYPYGRRVYMLQKTLLY